MENTVNANLEGATPPPSSTIFRGGTRPGAPAYSAPMAPAAGGAAAGGAALPKSTPCYPVPWPGKAPVYLPA